MSSNIREILERLDRGELNSEATVREINSEEDGNSLGKNRFLKVNVTRLHDGQPRVNIRIPFSLVGLGFAIGSKYAPELNELNLDQIVEELRDLTGGTLVEVQDFEEDEHVLISVEYD